jgi:hypothetical protein
MHGDRYRSARGPALVGLAAFLACAVPAAAEEHTFRVRADFDAPLNADSGWAGAPGEPVMVEADRPFRLRLETEALGDGGSYVLQARRNGGDWQTLEAQEFPYPQRELELDFADPAAGLRPEGWNLHVGDAGSLRIVNQNAGRVLRVEGGADGLAATYPPPWPLPSFALAARFRLPDDGRSGWAMMFAHRDAGNFGFVRFDQGNIAIGRVADGVEALLLHAAVPLQRGAWHDAEIELENGRLTVSFDDAHSFEAGFPDALPGLPGLLLAPGATVELAKWVIEGVARTPGVSIVQSSAYANGAATADLVAGSAKPFAPAMGLSLAEQTPVWGAPGCHGEFEWPLVIRRFGDGPVVNQSGDRFEFRMAGPSGHSAVARVTLAVPPQHLGGTYVENPGRIGPWQASNGDLYFIMEPTETDNKFMMMKSADAGRTWTEVDGDNRPITSDLESVDGRLVGDRVHIVHQVTHSVRYHEFRTSDHPTHPDSWATRDEVAAEAEAIAQMATLAPRPDGTLVSVFLADRLYHVTRSIDGRWSRPVAVDPDEAAIGTGPQAVTGRDGLVHLAYTTSDGRIWYRRLQADGSLSPRQALADGAGATRAEYGAVLPLAYDAASDTVSIVYRLEDGRLWERQVRGAGTPGAPIMVSGRQVITDAVDSQQPAADLVSHGGARHALWVDQVTRDIFSASADGSGWSEPVLQVEAIEGSWVRGNVVRKPDGTLAYGYVYDAGSGGGSGLNRYAELPLRPSNGSTRPPAAK